MIAKRTLLLSLSVVFFLLGPVAHSEEVKSNVSPLMQLNYQALLKLQQFVASPEEFSDPKNAEEIEKNLETLSAVGATLPTMISKDKPGLAAISSLFSEYIANTQKNFKSGYRDYARNQVRTITGFCMACHTSGDSIFQFQTAQKLPSSKDMTSYQKADFFTATRQFDKALEAYERIIFDEKPSTEKGVIDMAHAIRSYLSMSVRVKNDPKLTFGFLTKLEQSKNNIQFFENDVKQWKADTANWIKEKRVSDKASGKAKDMTAKALLAKSKSLIEQARKKQLFPADHTGDVNFLRATNYAHLAIDKATNKAERSEGYFLLGRSYATLSDPFLWELDGLYFEACIQENPHTAQSRECFKHLASGVYFGYTGSGGTNVPQEDMNRLSKFRKLAE